MTGKLSGTQYRVVGRVVLGEDEDGDTYYWNEFNLESDGGGVATLVYEETEQGGEWRLFRLFEPAHPLTAADAATKRAGDPLNLDGVQMFVRLVSKSRIYHIEGKAPEGEAVGEVAHYFNAAAGNTMIVVSWTGEEVEFYKGLDLSPTTVSAAFNVRIVDFSRWFLGTGPPSPVSRAGSGVGRRPVRHTTRGRGSSVLRAGSAPASRCEDQRSRLAAGVGGDRHVGGNAFPGSESSAG